VRGHGRAVDSIGDLRPSGSPIGSAWLIRRVPHSAAVSARKDLRPARPRTADPMVADAQFKPVEELSVPEEHKPLGQRPPPPFLSWDDYYLYLSDPAGAASAVRTSLPKLGS
jgi:hypothetical protein